MLRAHCMGEIFTALYMVSLWLQDNVAGVPGGISKSCYIPQPVGSLRMILTASQVQRRKACSRAGFPCCTIRGKGHDGCLPPGVTARMLSQVHSQGCPGLSFRAGSLCPSGLCARVSARPARGAPSGAVGRICGWKKGRLRGQGPSAVERVLHGSGLLTAPVPPQNIS